MEKFDIYKDIAKRTGGDVYIGVVGPVRTGKSTFITRFTDLIVAPNIHNKNKRQIAVDEMPLSGGGKTITTTEPKFVPSEAVKIALGGSNGFNGRIEVPVYLGNRQIALAVREGENEMGTETVVGGFANAY